MGDLITLNCPSCGGKLEVSKNVSILNCVHCGSEHLVRREGGAVTLESFARCPKCNRNDRVEKVTVILRSHSKDTDLVKYLAKPIPPATDPKPEPLKKPELRPKPNLKPKPQPLPKPKLLPKPDLYIRKPKVIFLIIGLLFLLVTYVSALTSLGILIDEFEIAASACTGILASMFALFGGLMIYHGLSTKKLIPESDHPIDKLINEFDHKKFSITSVIIPILFFFISGGCILATLLGGIFREELVTITMVLALGFIPAIIGLYILAMKYLLVTINNKNIDILNDHKNKIINMEHANTIAIDNWKNNNQRMLDSWEEENSHILNDWRAEKSKIMQEWEQKNASLIQEWEEKQEKTLSSWYRANNRWQKLYFCHRDDIVFIPGEGPFSSTEKMNEYLTQGEK